MIPAGTNTSDFGAPSNTSDSHLLLNSYLCQLDAPQDLRVVSWPPSPPKPPSHLQVYLYNNDFVLSPMLYTIDGGLDTRSRVRRTLTRTQKSFKDSHVQDFDYSLRVRRWLFSPRVAMQGQATPTDRDSNSHGSCVASKASLRHLN